MTHEKLVEKCIRTAMNDLDPILNKTPNYDEMIAAMSDPNHTFHLEFSRLFALVNVIVRNTIDTNLFEIQKALQIDTCGKNDEDFLFGVARGLGQIRTMMKPD